MRGPDSDFIEAPSFDWLNLYDELRGLAANFLEREKAGHTLQPTALVHEVFLRLSASQSPGLPNRVTFLAAAANTMRRVLVDHARAKKCQKRGGSGGQRHSLDASTLVTREKPIDVLDLEDALRRLELVDPRLSRLVVLRYFAGMTEEESAEALNVSRRTIQADWRAAKAWLRRELAA